MSRLSQLLASFTPEELERYSEDFWSRIDRSGGPDACWPWREGVGRFGYGQIRFGGKRGSNHRRGITCSTHVVAWSITHGQVPEGLCVCHTCDVRYPVGSHEYRRCCNPAHLWLGTKAENNRDRDEKGRQAKGDRSGSRLHPESLARGNRNGMRLHPEAHASQVGELNNQAKLNESLVREIRSRVASGETYASVADTMNVNTTTIHAVVKRKTWRHV